VELFIIAFFILTLWGVAVINPSILGMIESLGGPHHRHHPVPHADVRHQARSGHGEIPGSDQQRLRGDHGPYAISAILYQLLG
jgi:serine transporter